MLHSEGKVFCLAHTGGPSKHEVNAPSASFEIHDDDLCVMCGSGEEETIEHLFFTRPFALDCWRSIHINSDMSMDLMDRFSTARQVHNMDFFPEATLIAAWELWKLRNDKIFQRKQPSRSIWLCNFKNQCLLQSVRFKEDLRSSFCFWLDASS